MLIHFTKNIEALSSITSNGFLYLHNETGILGPAVRDAFGIEAADSQSNGMICFTELSPSESHSHQSKFGKFGVGVSKEWLVENDAQKVTYVQIGSESYNSLVVMLKSLAPKTLWGVPTEKYLADPKSRFMGVQALTVAQWALQTGASREYVEFLETLTWTQTDRDEAEREWRVRNPKPYRFLGSPGRQQQIDLLVNCISDANVQDEFEGLLNYTIDGSVQLACVGKLSLVLQLPKEKIRALFCPEEYGPTIQAALIRAGLSHIPVIVSADGEKLHDAL